MIQLSEDEIYNKLKGLSTSQEGFEEAEVSSVLYTIPDVYIIGREPPFFTRDRKRTTKREDEWDNSDWFLELYERIQRYDKLFVEGNRQQGADFEEWSDMSSDEEGLANRARKEFPRLQYAFEKYCKTLREERRETGCGS